MAERRLGIGDVGVKDHKGGLAEDEGSSVELVERPHAVALDGPLAPRRQIVDHDEKNVDHIVVGLSQEAVGVAGQRGQATLGRPVAEALGLGRGRVGGKGTHPPRRQSVQSEATGTGDQLDFVEPVEGSACPSAGEGH